MDRIIVRRSEPLEGTVTIGGAKNSVLKLMAASLLAPGTHVLHRVPRITDVACMRELLGSMGVQTSWIGPSSLEIVVADEVEPEAPYELVEKFRASIVVMGPLLARCGRARVALPGGDDFGPRPIDMHLRALEDLGATFETAHGYIEGRADHLLGTRLLLCCVMLFCKTVGKHDEGLAGVQFAADLTVFPYIKRGNTKRITRRIILVEQFIAVRRIMQHLRMPRVDESKTIIGMNPHKLCCEINTRRQNWFHVLAELREKFE